MFACCVCMFVACRYMCLALGLLFMGKQETAEATIEVGAGVWWGILRG